MESTTKYDRHRHLYPGKIHITSAVHLFKTWWLKLWKGTPPGGLLTVLGLVTAAAMSFPVLYVMLHSFLAETERWTRLLESRIPLLLWNTAILTAAVTFSAVFLGILLSWLVHRSDLPGRNTWKWLLALPLAVPPYVGAAAYIMLLGPAGWLGDYLAKTSFFVYSFWGTAFVLTAFTYPYVFLITGAAFKKMSRSYEEAARSQGLSSFEVFRKVFLPLLRPAVGAGGVLVALYVLSDFGAVTMLRYNTFTSAIYYQMGSYDNISASILSTVLVVITLFILSVEYYGRKGRRYHQAANDQAQSALYHLGRWKLPALLFVFLVFLAAAILPAAVLGYWSAYGIAEGAISRSFWLYAWNSIKVSGAAALLCMLLALPVVYLKSRYASLFSSTIEKLSCSGYALPGAIVALGVIFIFNRYFPWLYNTFYLLIFAYMVRFLPQAMQSGSASLSQVPASVDEAARSLGYSPLKVLFKVIIPLTAPGILAGGALVFVSSIKELPATLLLRPPGFDTMAVRVWVEASEAVYHMAAPGAILIILLSIPPLYLFLNR